MLPIPHPSSAVSSTLPDEALDRLAVGMRRVMLNPQRSADAEHTVLNHAQNYYIDRPDDTTLEEQCERLIFAVTGNRVSFHEVVWNTPAQQRALLGPFAALVSVASEMLNPARPPTPPPVTLGSPPPYVFEGRTSARGMTDPLLAQDGMFYERDSLEGLDLSEQNAIVCNSDPTLPPTAWDRFSPHFAHALSQISDLTMVKGMARAWLTANPQVSLYQLTALTKAYASAVNGTLCPNMRDAGLVALVEVARRPEDTEIQQTLAKRLAKIACGRTLDPQTAQVFIHFMATRPDAGGPSWFYSAGRSLAFHQAAVDASVGTPIALAIDKIERIGQSNLLRIGNDSVVDDAYGLTYKLLAVPVNELTPLSEAVGILCGSTPQSASTFKDTCSVTRHLLELPHLLRLPVATMLRKDNQPITLSMVRRIVELCVARMSHPSLADAIEIINHYGQPCWELQRCETILRPLTPLHRSQVISFVRRWVPANENLLDRQGQNYLPAILENVNTLSEQERDLFTQTQPFDRNRPLLAPPHTRTLAHPDLLRAYCQALRLRLRPTSPSETPVAPHPTSTNAVARRGVAPPAESVETDWRRHNLREDLLHLKKRFILNTAQVRNELASISIFFDRSRCAPFKTTLNGEPSILERARHTVDHLRHLITPTDQPLRNDVLCAMVWKMINAHRTNDEAQAAKDRENMRLGLVRALADCAPVEQARPRLVCANGQGQQLISVLSGYGYKLPSEAILLTVTPRELLSTVSQAFAQALSSEGIEVLSHERAVAFVTEARATVLARWPANEAIVDQYMKELRTWLEGDYPEITPLALP